MLWRHSPGIRIGRRYCRAVPHWAFIIIHSALIVVVLDVLALIAIAVGFGKRIVTGIAPVVPGAAQHR